MVNVDFANFLRHSINAFAILFAVDTNRNQRLIHSVTRLIGSFVNRRLDRSERFVDACLGNCTSILDEPRRNQRIG